MYMLMWVGRGVDILSNTLLHYIFVLHELLYA